MSDDLAFFFKSHINNQNDSKITAAFKKQSQMLNELGDNVLEADSASNDDHDQKSHQLYHSSFLNTPSLSSFSSTRKKQRFEVSNQQVISMFAEDIDNNANDETGNENLNQETSRVKNDIAFTKGIYKDLVKEKDTESSVQTAPESAQEEDEEEDHVDQESTTLKWWDDACSYIEQYEPSSAAFQHLQSWKQGVAEHDRAQEQLGSVMDDCKTILEGKVNQLLVEVAVPIHENVYQQVACMQKELGDLLESNHSRRKSLLQCLDKANYHWQQNHKKLVDKVLNHSSSSNDLGGNKEVHESVLDGKTVEQSNDGNPDWEEMVYAYPNCQPHVEAYLQGVERLKDAEDRLNGSLDDIHHQLQQATERILQVVANVHELTTPTINEHRNELQHLLSNNSQRRKEVQMQLEESVKRTQGILTRLMAQVSSSLPPAKP